MWVDPLTAAVQQETCPDDDGTADDGHPQPTEPAPRTVQPPADRAAAFRARLSAPTIDMRELRALAFQGVPDERGLRAAVWRCLLGLLPPERAAWDRALARKRAEYAQFCEDLIIDPKKLSGSSSGSIAAAAAAAESDPGPLAPGSPASTNGAGSASGGGGSGSLGGSLTRMQLAQEDHPLSVSDGSKWKAYFQDAEMQEQIERDVQRTHPDMHFFSGGSPAVARRRAAMQRALFVFAKLNPGIRYVQGMNELLAPLYWLFATDPDESAALHAEADSFYCLVDLMGEFRDHFCKQLDNSAVGIRASMTKLSTMLRLYDEELWEHLEVRNKVNPQFYAFRWITLLLTQEFSFPDALRLWDSLLSDPAGRQDCLLRLCCAMLLHVREEVMAGDFASNMKLLQRFPPVDVHVILGRAEALRSMKPVIILE